MAKVTAPDKVLADVYKDMATNVFGPRLADLQHLDAIVEDARRDAVETGNWRPYDNAYRNLTDYATNLAYGLLGWLGEATGLLQYDD